MKLEFKGTKMIGLCSKSYIAVNEQENVITDVKFSLKGVNKHHVNPVSEFEKVLNNQQPISSVNRGIRQFDNSVFTYMQPKQAFNYFYCKRVVQADGIHTSPLAVTLRPINTYKQKQQEFQKELEEEVRCLYESLTMMV